VSANTALPTPVDHNGDSQLAFPGHRVVATTGNADADSLVAFGGFRAALRDEYRLEKALKDSEVERLYRY